MWLCGFNGMQGRKKDMMNKVLEVCVDSLASARAAIAGGADRLELCAALSIGGLTPYGELYRQIRRESNIAIRAMIRPRSGDFLYEPAELELMQMQIETLRGLGVDGFVFGCLTNEGELNLEAMKTLMKAAEGCKVTLHRAIDVSRDPEKTYRDAGELGVDSVLTSGGACNCMAGKDTIGRLLDLEQAGHGPQVLIGAGVNAGVITQLRTRFPMAHSFHLSGKREMESTMVFRRADVPMGLPGLDEWHYQQTDAEKIKAARAAIDG